MKCCLCGKKIKGYGNNASPLNNGECCDECNTIKVIPKRLEIMAKNLIK